MTLTALSHPTATQVRVGLMTVLDEGWLAFESIKLSSLSAPIAVRPGQDHTLAAQINGQVNGANAARLFIKCSNGTIVNVWQNTSTFNDSQSVSGSFTTPATVASFQVGTAVTLDKGYLEFSKVTLTAYSVALPITAGDTYQFTGQVAGALAAPLGQGGRIVAAYANAAGQSAGEDLLWQNPTNFNGTLAVQQTVTANANAATLRVALTAVLDAGHLDFGDFDRQRLTAGAVIRRSTYMLAGQAVAVRVTTTDPDGDSGLYYLYSDHLGSASAIQKDDGSAPIVTRYLPFGNYRAGSGPNQVTDRGFTGQPENMDLGLYYYQARFYVPGIGRFASADTIVPDPANPQQYNRYTYTLNNPLRYTDPTGHVCYDPSLDAVMPGNCNGGSIPLPTPPPRPNIAQQVLDQFCNTSILACSGPGIGHITIDLYFLQNLAGYDPGIINLPYHINPDYSTPNSMFPWEGVANVTYAEHSSLHPRQYPRGSDEREYFAQNWLGEATGIIQTMINRAVDGNYKSPNHAALTGGQYAAPGRKLNDSHGIYQEFYGLAFMVIQLEVRVDQPYQSFVHQDLLPLRGTGSHLNDTCCTDTAAFGHWSEPKNWYIPQTYPYIFR